MVKTLVYADEAAQALLPEKERRHLFLGVNLHHMPHHCVCLGMMQNFVTEP